MTVVHIPASECPTPKKVDERRVELRLDARTLSEQSQTSNLELSKNGQFLTLPEGVPIENDGAAAGYSYKPNEEVLSEGVQIKKSFQVRNPVARGATLLVGGSLGAKGNPIEATINGKSVKLEPAGTADRYWQAFRFDPTVLEQGHNEFILSGTGKVWIARDDERWAGDIGQRYSPSSAKCSDGGKTWAPNRLGPRGDIPGEYCVRLYLDQFADHGVLISPVIDLGNLAQNPVSCQPQVAKVRAYFTGGNKEFIDVGRSIRHDL